MPAVLDKKTYEFDLFEEYPELIVNDNDLMSDEEVEVRKAEFEQAHAKAFRKQETTVHRNSFKSGFRRFIETFFCCILIVTVALFAASLLYPQMALSEISKDNSDLKDEISLLRKQILNTQENINGITDMDTIRAQAFALGMQDPNANQVIIVPIANDDKLTTMITYDSYGVSEEAYNNAVGNLARYYLESLSEQG